MIFKYRDIYDKLIIRVLYVNIEFQLGARGSWIYKVRLRTIESQSPTLRSNLSTHFDDY